MSGAAGRQRWHFLTHTGIAHLSFLRHFFLAYLSLLFFIINKTLTVALSFSTSFAVEMMQSGSRLPIRQTFNKVWIRDPFVEMGIEAIKKLLICFIKRKQIGILPTAALYCNFFTQGAQKRS